MFTGIEFSMAQDGFTSDFMPVPGDPKGKVLATKTRVNALWSSLMSDKGKLSPLDITTPSILIPSQGRVGI